MKNVRYIICCLFILSGSIFFDVYGQTKNTAVNKKHPNIILILTDDQGWGDLSIFGNTNIQTPNIDRLANEGVIFDRFFVSPVCSPTRAEILTGRYLVRGGVSATSAGGERLDLDETTMAEMFKQAGYATALYGKWHNGAQPPYHPNNRGFDDFYGFCSGHWGNYFSPMLEHNGEIVKGNGFIIDDLTDHGVEFIESKQNQPFLLFLAYNTPHSPMQVPDEWWEKYKKNPIRMRNRNPELEDIQFTRAALALCENIDYNVGRIVDKIESLRLSDNTIVIYLSDNGPNSWRWNGGMKGKKGNTDEGGVRVPMFMKWPGVLSSGIKIRHIASGMDLLPTLIDLAEIKRYPEKPFDGKSLKSLLNSENPNWDDRFIINYWNNEISIRSQKFRFDKDGQLFDMEECEQQQIDVSIYHPNVVRKMQGIKNEWIKKVLVQLPQKEKRPFTVGFNGNITHLPAADGTSHGNIQRSNRWPNDSYFTNWKSLNDSITWNIEVLEEGIYDVEIYYTCSKKSVGSEFEICFHGSKISGKLAEANNPPLVGMQKDRVEREESYTKDFKPLKINGLKLEKDLGNLILKATNIQAEELMDFRLLTLKKQ